MTSINPLGAGLTIQDVQALMPALTPALAQILLDEWVEVGSQNFEVAVARMRQAPEWEAAFPGMRREDGSLRFRDENEYLATIDSYTRSLLDAGVNPDLFRGRYVELVENEVSPVEFAQRVDTIQARVLSRSDELKEEFARVNGFGITDSALIAAALDPEIDAQILEERISIAEIGAEATTRGFDQLDLDLQRNLFQRNFDRRSAADLFGQAQQLVPIIDTLAQRHLDPDDTFDLTEFIEGFAFGDPLEQRRVRRLLAQEAASFTPTATRTGPAGEVFGLEEL